MSQFEHRHGLEVDTELARFLEEEALPGAGVPVDAFWGGFADLLHRFTPRNQALLDKREELQRQIDVRNETLAGQAPLPEEEERFLRGLGYLVEEPKPFTSTLR